MLENVDLEDFSDEEEGKKVIEWMKWWEDGVEEVKEPDGKMRSKIEKVERMLNKASKAEKLSAKTLINLVKLFKKAAI